VLRPTRGLLAAALLAIVSACGPHADCEKVVDHSLKILVEAKAPSVQGNPDKAREQMLAQCTTQEPPLKMEKCVMLAKTAEELELCQLRGVRALAH
jgi:hypothetical protein